MDSLGSTRHVAIIALAILHIYVYGLDAVCLYIYTMFPFLFLTIFSIIIFQLMVRVLLSFTAQGREPGAGYIGPLKPGFAGSAYVGAKSGPVIAQPPPRKRNSGSTSSKARTNNGAPESPGPADSKGSGPIEGSG